MSYCIGAVLRRPGLGILVGGLVLLAGCGLLGLDDADLERPSFSVTSGLADRISVLADTTEAGMHRRSSAAAFRSPRPLLRVRPPTVNGTLAQASHLSVDSVGTRLYVGYKLGGSPFGGAVDVLRVQEGVTPREVVGAEQSLRSNNVDVVEVRPSRGDDAMYVAGAVNTRKLGGAPAAVSRIALRGGEAKVRSERLSHFVAKSLVLGPAPNQIHVITDENALYRFDTSLKSQKKLTAGGAVGFRSLALRGSELFVLDQSGRVFQEEANVFSDLSEVAVLAENRLTNGAIARLFAGDDRLFAALNQEGFSIFAPGGEEVWTSGSPLGQTLYTCITTGAERLYVGRLDGFIEVYRLPEGIPSPNQGLERIGRFGLTGGGTVYGEGGDGVPVNQMLISNGYLYAATSTAGLVVYELTNGASSR